MRAVVTAASIMIVLVVMAAGAALAEEAAPAVQPAPVVVAAAAPAPAGASTAERLDALEKQNLVLSEDLGKSQLETRQLQEVTKRQAAQIEKLNKQVADQQAQMKAEKEKQSKRNRYMWIAVGVLALGVIAAN